MKEVIQRFLTNTDDTGRFIVTSSVTGKKYFVEPLNGAPIKWGDVNPATGKVEGDYGGKYRGSVSKEDSIITEDNGFIKIKVLDAGVSPFSEIYQRDLEYEKLLVK